MDLQAALGQNPPSFDIKLSKLKGLKPPGSPGAVFRSFSKFRIVYKEGIEISRQFWNRISPFFLGNLVCRWSSNSKIAFDRLTVDFFHVEVGRRIRPPKHGGSLQLAQRCQLAFPEIFAKTHVAFGVDDQLRSSRRRQTNTHRSLYYQQAALTDCLCTRLQSNLACNTSVCFEALELTEMHLRNGWYGRSS